jgi:hypothetical protein
VGLIEHSPAPEARECVEPAAFALEQGDDLVLGLLDDPPRLLGDPLQRRGRGGRRAGLEPDG